MFSTKEGKGFAGHHQLKRITGDYWLQKHWIDFLTHEDTKKKALRIASPEFNRRRQERLAKPGAKLSWCLQRIECEFSFRRGVRVSTQTLTLSLRGRSHRTGAEGCDNDRNHSAYRIGISIDGPFRTQLLPSYIYPSKRYS